MRQREREKKKLKGDCRRSDVDFYPRQVRQEEDFWKWFERTLVVPDGTFGHFSGTQKCDTNACWPNDVFPCRYMFSGKICYARIFQKSRRVCKTWYFLLFVFFFPSAVGCHVGKAKEDHRNHRRLREKKGFFLQRVKQATFVKEMLNYFSFLYPTKTFGVSNYSTVPTTPLGTQSCGPIDGL